MRCFVAIDIDENLKESLVEIQDQMRENVGIDKGEVSWVRPEAMHLTLKFLGEIKYEEAVEVCEAVGSGCRGKKGFNMSVEKLGCFGGKSARVVWAGTGNAKDGRGTEKLEELQKSIEDELFKAGFAKDARKFSGHLTICRVKKYKTGLKVLRFVEDYGEFSAGESFADKVTVYQSEQSKQGPIYTVLGQYDLES